MSHTGPILEGRGNSDYERYVRVPELLELQKTPAQIVNPEELLFQTMHQTAELWLKHIDYEIDRAVAALAGEEFHLAADLMDRCTKIVNVLRDQIVVLETMAPADYHVIRTSSLGRGSGQESPGFQKLLDAGKRLWPPFQKALAARSLTILDVERKPREQYELFRVIQALLDYDETFMKWRFVHMRLAFRIIGSRVMSLKGVPAAQLDAGTREPQFPELWEAISDLTAEWKPTY